MAEEKQKNKSGAGKFFLGAALGAIAGAIAGKFVSVKAKCDCDDKCDCDEGCDCRKEKAAKEKV